MKNKSNATFLEGVHHNSLERCTKSAFIKIILLGDLNVGKSTIATMFLKGFLKDTSMCKIVMDYNSKEIIVNDTRVELQIWDTCGQEEYKSLTKQYYRDCKGCLLVYDMTNMTSFINLVKWKDEINKNLMNDISVVLVGNKKDLNDQRKVSEIEGKCIAEKNGWNYIETSGVSLYNIKEAFRELTSIILKRNNPNYIKSINTIEHPLIQLETLSPKKTRKDIIMEQLKKHDEKTNNRLKCC